MGYGSLGRLTNAVNSNTAGPTLTMFYNGLGQRVLKSSRFYTNGVPMAVAPPSPSGATKTLQTGAVTQASGFWTTTMTDRFVYDDQGHLLGEYDSTSGYTQETIWFNGQPVAAVIGGVTYYVSADNLGSPRSLVRASDNVEVWRWDSDPFGNAIPQGQVTYNLRFPGQYADSETNLNYNGMRDYDPWAGRYIEADPIGLGGGLSRYAYVGGNPLSGIDQFGLRDITKWFRGTPGDAITYRASDGSSFAAPPSADWSAIYVTGQLNGLSGANSYIGRWGSFDFQRDGSTFIGAYSDASNYAVGVYMSGAGYSMTQTDIIAGTFALLAMSSNAGDPKQSQWWHNGWTAAETGLPNMCMKP